MSPRPQNGTPRTIAIIVVIVIALFMFRRNKNRVAAPGAPSGGHAAVAPPATSPSAIAELFPLVRASDNLPRKEGIAAAILIDTSGSMGDRPANDPNGSPKIETARRCVVKVMNKMQQFAKEQPDRPVIVGVYEFSNRSGKPPCREVTGMGKPDPGGTQLAVQKIVAQGDTPIGDSIVYAKQQLDRTRMSRTHILVITDGENTAGHTPGDAVYALMQLPEDQRPGIYFVAFDVSASVFQPAKDGGASILPASNEQELQKALDALVGDKILIEQ